ncbi:hypothetical protein RCL1_006729 [Eukaryota sp. TZLM3-RCL]
MDLTRSASSHDLCSLCTSAANFSCVDCLRFFCASCHHGDPKHGTVKIHAVHTVRRRLLCDHDEVNPAFLYCVNCQRNFCTSCSDYIHNINPKRRSHTLVPISFSNPASQGSKLRLVRVSPQTDAFSFSEHKVETEGIRAVSSTDYCPFLRIKWDKEARSCLVIVTPAARGCIRAARVVSKYLRSKNLAVYCEKLVHHSLIDCGVFAFFQQSSQNLVDFIVTIGDDFTVIYAASLFPKGVPPIIGLSVTSKTSFLTPWMVDNYQQAIKVVLSEEFPVSIRKRLDVKLNSSRNSLNSFTVLSEVVIDRGNFPSLCNIDTYCDDHFMTTVQGDGLVISTPTGSPYYSSSAGGPIIHPSVPAIILTPVCPHSLSFRPLVLPDSCTWSLKVSEQSRNPVLISFDGRFKTSLHPSDSVVIESCKYPVPLVLSSNITNEWIENLRHTLPALTTLQPNISSEIFEQEEEDLKNLEISRSQKGSFSEPITLIKSVNK